MNTKNIFSLCTVFAVFILGCGSAHYEYPPYQPGSLACAKTFPLRVAIPYPEEGLVSPNRDEDLEPIINSRCHATPTYISQRLEISRGLLDELRSTRAFQAVHWVPESLDDYDLVVRMKLLSGGKRFESETCPALLGPYTWELSLFDQRGNLLLRREMVLAAVKIYSRRPVAEFRKDEAVFLMKITGLILEISERITGNNSDIAGARALTYMEKKDPELKKLRDQAVSAAGNKKLGNAYIVRVSRLEAKRLTENRTTEALQLIYDQVWLDIQEEFRRELQALGESVNRMLLENLDLLTSGIDMYHHIGRIRPARIVDAVSKVRNEMTRSVTAPDGTRALVDKIPESILPGKFRKLAMEAGINEQLSREVRKAIQEDVRPDAGK